jgi:hypothetical protein
MLWYSPGGGSMLEYHREPVPATCDVCRYAVDHRLDSPYEHALTRLATLSLVEDLTDLGAGTTRLSALAVSQSGVEPGPVHSFDPRHWFWAMFYEPRIRLSLERSRP